ncbi:MMPL family transporter [Actinocorallia populi]|uniref:MMPL family transporter n=1 Tax=Actinocorallia populi TaxID=2079200 RepID=UPI000D094286|nr:MMPL family transporter [Actinocorallia populi]
MRRSVKGPPVFGFLDRLARSRPRRALAFGALLLVLGVVSGGVVYPRLTASLADYDDPGSPVVAAQESMQRATGANPQQGYVVVVRSDVPLEVSAAPPPAVVKARELLEGRPEVTGVLDYTTARDPSLISRDGRSTYLVAGVGEVTEKEAVADLRDAVEADPVLRDAVLLGGHTVANVETAEISTEDLAKAEALAIPLLLLGLLVVFRGFVAAGVPLLGAVFTIVVTFAGLAAAMAFTSVSVFAMNLVTSLGMGLAIDFSLLMVTRFRLELAGGANPSDAVGRSLATAGRTVLFSASLVASAMASLLVFPQKFIFSVGLAGVLVTVTAALFALVVLPALLRLLGHRIDALAPKAWRRGREASGDRWHRIAHTVMKRPLVFAVVVTAVLLAAGAPFTKVTFGGFDAAALPEDAGSAQVFTALRQDFADASSSPATLLVTTSDGASMSRYAASLREVAGVGSVAEPTRLADGMWKVDVRLAFPPLTPEARDAVRGLAEAPAPGPVGVVGETARFEALLDSLAERLPWALGILFALGYALLFAMTRSVVLPVKTFLINMLSVCATFGILMPVFQWGWFGFERVGSLEVTTLILAGVLVFALATDYGVFLLHRIKEERDGGLADDEAVAEGLRRTGPVVSAAAVLMFIPFIVLCLARIPAVRELGLAAGLAILIDATVVRGVLVPALMALLGRWNWWAPGRRRAPRAEPERSKLPV